MSPCKPRGSRDPSDHGLPPLPAPVPPIPALPAGGGIGAAANGNKQQNRTNKYNNSIGGLDILL